MQPVVAAFNELVKLEKQPHNLSSTLIEREEEKGRGRARKM